MFWFIYYLYYCLEIDFMAFLDYNSEINLDLNIDSCYNLINKVIEKNKNFKLDSYDDFTGRIVIKTKLSLFSWGENVYIQLTKVNSKKTNIKLMSTPKTGVLFGGALDFGKNRANIDLIISEISKEFKKLKK